MQMFASEKEFLETITRHDELVRRCIRGEISFAEFCDLYHEFYAYYALDGHESDEEERELLARHDARIAPHRIITYEILWGMCSDENAELEDYKLAGRFGSAEALRRLKQVQLYST
jgi:hypothetical protein